MRATWMGWALIGLATVGCSKNLYHLDPFSAALGAEGPSIQEGLPAGDPGGISESSASRPAWPGELAVDPTDPNVALPMQELAGAPFASEGQIPTAVIAEPAGSGLAAAPALPDPAATVVPAAGQVPAAPAAPVQPAAAEQPKAGAELTRDPQYRWLQGRLQYIGMEGRWQLRYAPYSVEDDRFGGSVMLQSDPRLDGFQSGDRVYVEGELVQKTNRMRRDNVEYRVTNIRSVGD